MFNHFRNTGFPCVCVSVCPEPFLATGAHKTKHIFEKRWVNEAPFVCAGVRAQVCSLCWHARRFQCPHYFREVVRLALETEYTNTRSVLFFIETRFLELCFYEICFLSLSRQIRFAFRLFLFSFCVVLCLCFILFVSLPRPPVYPPAAQPHAQPAGNKPKCLSCCFPCSPSALSRACLGNSEFSVQHITRGEKEGVVLFHTGAGYSVPDCGGHTPVERSTASSAAL
jgi:hypothetical protein